MANNKTTPVREQQIKTPRKVTLAIIAPWIIIMVLFAASSGVVGGWFLARSFESEKESAVHSAVTSLKVQSPVAQK